MPLCLIALGVAEPATGAEEPQGSAILEHSDEAWTGDLDGILERGFLRILTAYSPLNLFYDGERPRGLIAEAAHELERHLRKTLGKRARNLNVIVKPVARDQLLPGLLAGKGDIAAANLTITPERQMSVVFSDPVYPGVDELVVTGPAAPPIETFDDLAGTEVHVRRSSSYFEHLMTLNAARKKEGKAEIPWRPADERLEDHDLLELLDTGVIPALIVDSHKIDFWAPVFKNIKVHADLAVSRGGKIAWALRPDNADLLAAVNGFIKKLHKGTLLGKILLKRYFSDAERIEDIRNRESQKRYRETIGLIQRHAQSYDFDWLMIAAQGYQESRLDQSKRSHAGAIGIMQVLPTTAADPVVGIPDIEDPNANVHAGVKYLRFLSQRYFDAPGISELDRVLFSFAAYNAGPGNIAKARRRAEKMGFDPNQWFGHVEVAAARSISREPVIYVRNIYKYYVAFKLMNELRQQRDAARQAED